MPEHEILLLIAISSSHLCHGFTFPLCLVHLEYDIFSSICFLAAPCLLPVSSTLAVCSPFASDGFFARCSQQPPVPSTESTLKRDAPALTRATNSQKTVQKTCHNNQISPNASLPRTPLQQLPQVCAFTDASALLPPPPKRPCLLDIRVNSSMPSSSSPCIPPIKPAGSSFNPQCKTGFSSTSSFASRQPSLSHSCQAPPSKKAERSLTQKHGHSIEAKLRRKPGHALVSSTPSSAVALILICSCDRSSPPRPPAR